MMSENKLRFDKKEKKNVLQEPVDGITNIKLFFY